MTTKEHWVYDGRFIKVRHQRFDLPNGKSQIFEIVHHPGAAAVVPLSADGSSVLLLRQFRPAINRWIWEIPAGLLDPGEDPLICAERELKEETGWTGHHFEKVMEFFPSPGFSNEVTHIYKAILLSPGQKSLEDGEALEAHLLPQETVLKMIHNKEIIDPKTVIGLVHAFSPCDFLRK